MTKKTLLKKILEKKIKNIVKNILNEEIKKIYLSGEQEAFDDLKNWLTIFNPHGVVENQLIKYLNQKLAKKYGRVATMLAFDKAKKTMKCIEYKTTKDGRKIVFWKKEKCKI